MTATHVNGKRPAWNYVELGSCFELQNGVNFSASQKGSGLLVVDVLNMYSDDLYVRTDRLYRVDIKVPDDRLLRPGDLLFVRSSVKESGVGWPAIFKGHEEPITNCGFLIRARQRKQKLDPKFVVHYLRQAHIRAQMVSRAGKVAITNINQARLSSLKIPVPPLAQQRRIAEVLDRTEALRAKRRVALAQLDALTKSIFLDLFGDPLSNPRQWPQQNLETFFHFRTGKLDSNAAVATGRYPFFTCSRGDFLIDIFAFDCEALLLSGNNASADYSVKHYKGKFNAYQRTYIITLQDERNSYDYSRHVLEHRLGELKRISKGTGTKYLTMELLNRIRIPVPPVSLQREFSRRLAAVEKLKAAQRASFAEMDALFAALQHRAFRGEL